MAGMNFCSNEFCGWRFFNSGTEKKGRKMVLPLVRRDKKTDFTILTLQLGGLAIGLL